MVPIPIRHLRTNWNTLSTFMEYLGVSLFVWEAVYPESLSDPAGAKLLGKAPSQPYSWSTLV
jgi:hypothetical protein